MPFSDRVLGREVPGSVGREVVLPHRARHFASPTDWRDEVLYFLLVDRFSDGREDQRDLLDRGDLTAARPAGPGGAAWRWDRWAQSGDRWQGGNLRGVRSKIGYLRDLGVTTIWLSPVFRQRGHLDTYHGYGIQDFLDVDPRIGDRRDLVELIDEAHENGLRVILDVVFNHSGPNWTYPPDSPGGPHTPRYTSGRYAFGSWTGEEGQPIDGIASRADGVWPVELQDVERYTRAGSGDLGAGDIDDPEAEHKRTDFITLRDFRLSMKGLLTDLAGCYKYWIALTDCDGFRIDTLKHVSLEEARNFCGSIKEFAANIGKDRFLLVGEIAGGDTSARRYLDVLERNMDAALDIGELRLSLNRVAKGLSTPSDFFGGFTPGHATLGSHRNLGDRHVSILDDHDHVFGAKIRFAAESASTHQVTAGLALQLLTLGIPCIYYGTEQALGGPEPAERQWLPGWGSSDRYLREAMFGPEHPRPGGTAGLLDDAARDDSLPGFGPFGTAGRHCFDPSHATFLRAAALGRLRREFPALRKGRQYSRAVSFLGLPYAVYGSGEIIGWSRILDAEELLCVLNPHGTEARGGRVIVDADLNPADGAMTVVLNTAHAADRAGYTGPHRIGDAVDVRREPDGTAFVEIAPLPPSETLVLATHPVPIEGGISG